MPNGTPEELWKLVNQINSRGCARREDDSRRIDAVEDWLKSVEKKLDRITYGTFITMLSVLGWLIKLLIVGH